VTISHYPSVGGHTVGVVCTIWEQFYRNSYNFMKYSCKFHELNYFSIGGSTTNDCSEKIGAQAPAQEAQVDGPNSEYHENMIRVRVDDWIERWSNKKSLRQLLNSILGYKSGYDKGYLYRGVNTTRIVKGYRKSMLKIHPDKHVNSSYETRYKASEMFKIVSSLFEKYKKKRNVN